jgi:uncharacterized coiled-coil protein SlyX
MTVMQQSNDQLREDLSSNQKKAEQFQNTVRAVLHSTQESIRAEVNSVRSDLCSNKERLEQLQENIKADTLTVHENLLKRFDQQTQQLREEFASKLDAESRRVTSLVNQVQNEVTLELVAVKKQLQSLSTELDWRLGQYHITTQIVINELADQLEEYRAGVETKLAGQKESLDKFSEAATQEKSAVERHLDRLNAKFRHLRQHLMNWQPGKFRRQRRVG